MPLKFRTEIKLASQQQNLVDYKSKILLLGSCFSENIGEKLQYYKFNTLINPFGILFSPAAIAKVVEDIVAQKKHSVSDLVKCGDLYHSLDHHSSLSSANAKEVVDAIYLAQATSLNQLKQASHLMITLGTSWVYQYHQTKALVANCHKIPQTEFTKQLLSVDEVELSLKRIIKAVRKVNLSVEIIFTVSPVRHAKDGLLENSLSKAHLLSAIGRINKSSNASYFGSYEIMMDDLRDYRFYEADMLHPNEVAVHYIWEQFCSVWVDKNAQTYFKRITSIRQSKLHKPFNLESKAHQLFLEKLAIKQLQLEKELHVKF